MISCFGKKQRVKFNCFQRENNQFIFIFFINHNNILLSIC